MNYTTWPTPKAAKQTPHGLDKNKFESEAAMKPTSSDVNKSDVRCHTKNYSSYGLTVERVEDTETLGAVHRLTYDAYLGRGYCRPQASRSMALYAHLDGIPETTVLGVFNARHLVGTVSITKDGPRGLTADGAFKSECDAIRLEGRVLASTWRMASTRESGYGREVAMMLIKSTVKHWIREGIQTCVLALHPRHIRIYQRLLNMRVIGEKSCMDELSNAPAVLLRWDVERCHKRFY